jgi:hypothetical protein
MGFLKAPMSHLQKTLEVEDEVKKNTTMPHPSYGDQLTQDQHVMNYLLNSITKDVLAQVNGLEHHINIWDVVVEDMFTL